MKKAFPDAINRYKNILGSRFELDIYIPSLKTEIEYDGELKNYSSFKTVLIKFREFFKLEEFILKELDKYLWQFGRNYFPKTYY